LLGNEHTPLTAEAKKFNSRLLAALSLIVAVLGIRLLGAAIETSNWSGFTYSFLHVVVVAIGSYFAVRKGDSPQAG